MKQRKNLASYTYAEFLEEKANAIYLLLTNDNVGYQSISPTLRMKEVKRYADRLPLEKITKYSCFKKIDDDGRNGYANDGYVDYVLVDAMIAMEKRRETLGY